MEDQFNQALELVQRLSQVFPNDLGQFVAVLVYLPWSMECEGEPDYQGCLGPAHEDLEEYLTQTARQFYSLMNGNRPRTGMLRPAGYQDPHQPELIVATREAFEDAAEELGYDDLESFLVYFFEHHWVHYYREFIDVADEFADRPEQAYQRIRFVLSWGPPSRAKNPYSSSSYLPVVYE